jgi:hypothetical protein
VTQELNSVKPSLAEAQIAAKILFAPGQVVELRALGSRYTTSGYYDDHERLVLDTTRLAENPQFHGIYWTLQSPNPALLARSPNQFRDRVRETTSDADVKSFRWLLIDLDPDRPAKISATDDEKKAAYDVAALVIKYFRDLGHDPVFADSGNGYHVLVRIDLSASDVKLVERVLEALDLRFSTAGVKVDRKVFNPSRISKAYGTISRKGASFADRPHRASSIIHFPNPISAPLDQSVLEKIASEVKTKPKLIMMRGGKKKDLTDLHAKVEEFLKLGGVAHKGGIDYKDGWKWQLECCPFNAAHRYPDSIVTVTKDGALGFSCSHNSCALQHWEEFRKYVEDKLGHPFAFADGQSGLDGRTWISNDPGKVTTLVKQSEGLLHAIGLKYFERNGELVHTVYGRDGEQSKHFERDASSVVIQVASHETLVLDLDRLAVYFNENKDGMSACHVPSKLPSQLHNRVLVESRDVPYPTLDLVTPSPVLLPTGAVSESHFEEGVLFVPRISGMYEKVPARPTKNDAVKAMKQFEDVFSGFPFVDVGDYNAPKRFETASYAVVLSGILSLVARPYLRFDPVPLHAVTASSPRYGKSKIVKAIVAAGLGHLPTTTHFVGEEEFGKHLLPLMRAGDRAILIDNIEATLQGSKLCVLITEKVMKDRILCESKDVTLKNNCVFFATGNNLVIGGDLTTRALRCDIDEQIERPESRKFDFDPVARALERHPQLVVAALTALRAFLLSGTEWKLERAPWGGFDSWDRLISGCLTWLGYKDPYASRERVIAKDPIYGDNIQILESWHKLYRDRPVSFHEIKKDFTSDLYQALLYRNEWDGQRVKWVLSRLENKVVGGFRLQRLEGRSRFKVTRVAGAADSSETSKLSDRTETDQCFGAPF